MFLKFCYSSAGQNFTLWVLLLGIWVLGLQGFACGSDSTASATMWETWIRSLGQEDLLEKKMATQSSTLAQKIPWTEEP